MSSLHRIIFFVLHTCCVKAIEPLQEFDVAFKIPRDEILDWDGLNAEMGSLVTYVLETEQLLTSEIRQ